MPTLGCLIPCAQAALLSVITIMSIERTKAEGTRLAHPKNALKIATVHTKIVDTKALYI